MKNKKIQSFREFNENLNMPNDSKFELIGPDMDEILDAIDFINNNYQKRSEKLSVSWMPFIRLTALDNSLADSGEKSIFVKFEPEGDEKLHIRHINDMLDENNFKCKLYPISW